MIPGGGDDGALFIRVECGPESSGRREPWRRPLGEFPGDGDGLGALSMSESIFATLERGVSISGAGELGELEGVECAIISVS